MEIADINLRCQRIARTIGPRATINIVIGINIDAGAMIHVPDHNNVHVMARTWPELFAAIEREARKLALHENAGDLEYQSWAQPALMLAVE